MSDFFVWIEVMSKIFTSRNLHREDIMTVDWYSMCKMDRELMNHLDLCCNVARELWNLVLCFVINLVMSCMVVPNILEVY